MPPASRGLIASGRLVRQYAIAARPRSVTKVQPFKRRLIRKTKLTSENLEQTRQNQQGQQEQEGESRSYKDEHKRFEDEQDQNQEQEPRRPFFDISDRARLRLYRWLMYSPPVAFFFLFIFPVTPYHVVGESMSPLLNVNSSPELPEQSDWILVQRVLLSPTFRIRPSKWEIERGQIVVFHNPVNPSRLVVKRVVGIPGDRVKPLPGFAGGDEPVVVPYNHIWVEGDANDRDKSRDSNWYGPISQNLVTGFAKVLMTPWYSWTIIKTEEQDYPAKKSGRVEYDVVHDAKVNPDEKRLNEAFSDGTAERELATIRKNRDLLPTFMRDEKKFSKLLTMYGRAKWELGNEHPESQEVAQEIVDELEAAFEAVGLAKDGTLLPQTSVAQMEDEAAQRALKNYLKKQQGEEGT